MSNLLVFRTTVGFFIYKPQSFHIFLHLILNSNSAINFTQFSYKSFLRRPNGSELKSCLTIAEINFSYFAKIRQWLEMVDGKISRTQRVNSSHPSADCSRHLNLPFLFPPAPNILVTKYKGFLCNLFLLWE